jgi:hypothetical protein
VSESKLYTDILTAHSRGPTRLARLNAGMAYQGKVIERSPHRLILAPWYPVRLAPEGWSDLIGWTSIEQPSPFSGGGGYQKFAVFVGIEGKIGRARTTPEQDAFLETVRRMGGRAGVARSVEEAAIIINSP